MFHSDTAPTTANAGATGIAGEDGDDAIINPGSIIVSASLDTAGTRVAAKGITGGHGKDVITNTGTLTVAAPSTSGTSITAPDATS
ncbi:MAG: hypothetical protein ACE5NW_00680 [Acidiferrobacterales bacterium]